MGDVFGQIVLGQGKEARLLLPYPFKNSSFAYKNVEIISRGIPGIHCMLPELSNGFYLAICKLTTTIKWIAKTATRKRISEAV
jgi:hypothetical protein